MAVKSTVLSVIHFQPRPGSALTKVIFAEFKWVGGDKDNRGYGNLPFHGELTLCEEFHRPVCKKVKTIWQMVQVRGI